MTQVPLEQSLAFYSDPSAQKTRYTAVARALETTYGSHPAFFARSPGRVNIIGEHIDYCHFLVLPMAIEVDVVAAVAPCAAPEARIANINPKFSPETIKLPQDGSMVPIDLSHHTWGNYFRCAAIVAHKYLQETRPEYVSGGLKGLEVVFDGNVPTGGGLSSLAAFCIVATLAVLRVNGVDSISKEDLTRITVVCEHYVGLNNGGMDQAASVNGAPSQVLLVLFKPELTAKPFLLPKTDPETVFLITNSLVTSNKAETAPTNYNLRVAEVAVAADILAKKFSLKVANDSNLDSATLRGSFDAYFTQIKKAAPWDGHNINVGIERLNEMLHVVESVFGDHADGFSADEAAAMLGLSSADFSARYLEKQPVRFSKLQLYKRCKHVYSDARRVLEVLALARDFNGDSSSFLTQFGALMDDSQVSTRDYNMASTPECEELCRIGRENGAYGLRITGAGFGGLLVHVTTTDRLPALVDAIKTQYYNKRYPELDDAAIGRAVVVSKPAQGACIVAAHAME